MRNPMLPHVTAVQTMLSRRNLLRHTALAAILTPVLRRRDAAAATSPRRLVLVFSGNGPIEALGPASGTETNFQFHDWWKPLERHKARGIFMSNMAATGSNVVKGFAHGLGGQNFSGAGADEYKNLGETIDQTIGKRLEAEKRHGVVRSVVWGLAGGATGQGFSAGGGRDIMAELNPQNAWTTLFAQFVPPSAGGTAAAATLLARKKSMLDFLVQDCKAMGDSLGARGRQLLDEHCSTMRNMEMNLAKTPGMATSSCSKATDPGARAWTDPENVDLQMTAFTDLIGKTLACELTHVVAFQLAGQAARNRLAASYGVPSSPLANSGDSGPAHHPWTHIEPGPERTKALRIFQTFYSNKVAQLVDKLISTNDASGVPLIDSTVVLWMSELGGGPNNGDQHQTGALPAIMFGGGQGTFKTGRYIRGQSPDICCEQLPKHQAAGADMARVLVSAVQYMGLNDVKTVGAANVNGTFAPLYA